MMPSAAQFRAARAWLGWSRERAAHEAGINPSTLGKAERAAAPPGANALKALAAAYAAVGIMFIGQDTLHRPGHAPRAAPAGQSGL